ncbi:hypothetical protein [Hyalangium sp.]|uniref:hypothetical protein n=1 Tax=Hyalangium sp. TaxID=2028555 RepID=UPI002D3C8A41|nr:hypothetical protein [Hyalangium sp.]HYI01246.1 hypothetical protein [Hyalangium sp.]
MGAVQRAHHRAELESFEAALRAELELSDARHRGRAGELRGALRAELERSDVGATCPS